MPALASPLTAGAGTTFWEVRSAPSCEDLAAASTAEKLLTRAQQAGAVRTDLTVTDVLALATAAAIAATAAGRCLPGVAVRSGRVCVADLE